MSCLSGLFNSKNHVFNHWARDFESFLTTIHRKKYIPEPIPDYLQIDECQTEILCAMCSDSFYFLYLWLARFLDVITVLVSYDCHNK